MKDHCPRCLSSWEKSGIDNLDYCISRCGMGRYKRGPKQLPTFTCENIIEYQDLLLWDCDGKYCKYLKNNSEIIKLPYLKFDIEADKLKLYLTFS